MHEAHLIKNIFQYLQKEEESCSGRIKRICISLSEFGSLNEDFLRRQYKKESIGTRWESLEIEIKRIPFGPELEITKLEFE
jgi:Zn finger protein HypA/HybF involved in hydrogenase expression